MLKQIFIIYFPQNERHNQFVKDLRDKEFFKNQDAEKFNCIRGSQVYYTKVQKNLLDYSNYRSQKSNLVDSTHLYLGWAATKRLNVTIQFQNFVENRGIEYYISVIFIKYKMAHPFSSEEQIYQYIERDIAIFKRNIDGSLSIFMDTWKNRSSNAKMLRQDYCKISHPQAANKLIPISKKYITVGVMVTVYSIGAICSEMYAANEKLNLSNFGKYVADYQTYNIQSYVVAAKKFISNWIGTPQGSMMPQQSELDLITERSRTPSENVKDRNVLLHKEIPKSDIQFKQLSDTSKDKDF